MVHGIRIAVLAGTAAFVLAGAAFANDDRRDHGTVVDAPTTEVDTRNGETHVRAPFTDVETGHGETHIRAPFVDIEVPSRD
jgi:hypothetical protein